MKHWIKALDPDSPTNVLTFARGLNGPIATELAPDGSLLVLNRATIWRDSKKFVADAGSFVRIRYVGSNTRPTDPVRNSFVVALGLPSDAAQLPRTLTRADWQNTLRDAKGSPFWMNAQAWQPFAEERIKLYLPPVASVKTELPSGAVVAREFAIGDRPIETRLLVIGTPRGYGASYRWITPERAQLVEDGELETTLPWWFPGV